MYFVILKSQIFSYIQHTRLKRKISQGILLLKALDTQHEHVHIAFPLRGRKKINRTKRSKFLKSSFSGRVKKLLEIIPRTSWQNNDSLNSNVTKSKER